MDNAAEPLDDKELAIFSYGSGCTGEFYTGTFQPSYKKLIDSAKNKKLIDSRKELDFGTYLDFYSASDLLKNDSGNYATPDKTQGSFRFCGIKNHCRIYERCSQNAL